MVSTLTPTCRARVPMVYRSAILTPYLSTGIEYADRSRSKRRQPMSAPQSGRAALMTGGLAAILASTCCLGPLVLVALGFSGAWIGNLTVLEPYRPIFIGGAHAGLFFGGLRGFRRPAATPTGAVYTVPRGPAYHCGVLW